MIENVRTFSALTEELLRIMPEFRSLELVEHADDRVEFSLRLAENGVVQAEASWVTRIPTFGQMILGFTLPFALARSVRARRARRAGCSSVSCTARSPPYPDDPASHDRLDSLRCCKAARRCGETTAMSPL